MLDHVLKNARLAEFNPEFPEFQGFGRLECRFSGVPFQSFNLFCKVKEF